MISITTLGPCACAVAHNDSPPPPFWYLGEKKNKNIAEAEMNKQKCTKPGNHKNGNSAGYPVT